MTDPAWSALAPWEQVAERDKDNNVAFCIGVGATWYFDAGHTDDKRRAALECMNEYLSLCGSSLRYWVVEGKSMSKVAALKSRDMSPYLLSPKWNTAAAYHEVWAFLWHGGQDADDASPFHIYALGASKRESEIRDSLSFLQVSFPISFVAEKPAVFIDLTVRWSARLQALHGYGGLTIIPSPNDGFAQVYESKMAGLATRHPGLEVEDPMGHSMAAIEGITGGNWLTTLSTAFLDRLGGLAALRAALGADFEVREYEGGAVIVAGPAPEVGDWNRNIDTPRLRRLARVLKPIRVTSHPPIHARGKFSTEEGFAEWLTRFDR